MSEVTVKANLTSVLEKIKKSKNALAPLLEALSNSIEAIHEKQNFATDEKPEINITFNFTGLFEQEQTLSKIIVQDNGIGFNPRNYSRFETVWDKSKGYNNRGSGRIQFVHYFDSINVTSYYIEKGEHFKRSFSCSKNTFINSAHNDPDPEKHNSGSTITFHAGASRNRDQTYFDNIKIIEIVRDLKRHFMLRYYLALENREKEPKVPTMNIVFTTNGGEIARASIKPEDMPAPAETGFVRVKYCKLHDSNKPTELVWESMPENFETLKWAHFRIPEADLNSNGVWLCSKGVTVAPITYEAINKHVVVKGNRFLTVFYGDVLDDAENVSDSVDSFKFPVQKEVEARIREGDLFASGSRFLFYDNIKREINTAIGDIYKDVLDIQKAQDNQVEKIALAHGISLEIARKAKIKINDTSEKITDKLFKEQAEYCSKASIRIREVFTELKKLDPISKTYQEELQARSSELLSLIPQQNKEELGRYVIRREMVAEILRKILEQELDYQKAPAKTGTNKEPEGLIHDLIFKRKSATTEQFNDLWILNEEYVHYTGCSELPINQIVDEKGQPLLRPISDEAIKERGIKPGLRPDIFLYPEEGKCVLVELKALDVNLADHISQMTKYCNLIASYSVRRIQKFYCYLIGEKFNPYADLDGNYVETVSGDWIGPNVPIRTMDQERAHIGTLQIEVSKLSSLYARAHRRNKSFADKLGLRELLSPEAEAEKS